MQQLLPYPQPSMPPLSFVFFVRFIEWAMAILLIIAAFPALKQIGIYLLTKLYEVFIQYQYLF